MSDQGLQGARSDTEAAEWLVRLKRRRVDRGDLRAFWAWRADDANAQAYARVERAWTQSQHLARDPEIEAATERVRQRTLPKPTLTWSPISRPGFGVGLAGLLAAVIGGGLWFKAESSVTFATRVGEERVVVLQDGSRVRLNTNSRMRVHLTPDKREILLLRGEGFFDVAHDGRRPFVVEAADANVTAVGTKFDVRRDSSGVWVALVEGRVHVGQDHRSGAAVLAPNQQLTVTPSGISAPVATDAVQSTSWTTGRLTFHDVALSEAIAQVNRYSDRKVVLEAPLADARVSGIFNTGDTASFVLALQKMYGLQVARGGRGNIRLVGDAAHPAE